MVLGRLKKLLEPSGTAIAVINPRIGVDIEYQRNAIISYAVGKGMKIIEIVTVEDKDAVETVLRYKGRAEEVLVFSAEAVGSSDAVKKLEDEGFKIVEVGGERLKGPMVGC